jgi:hypothetical protein
MKSERRALGCANKTYNSQPTPTDLGMLAMIAMLVAGSVFVFVSWLKGLWS